jgi:hypothetical protein
MAPSDVFFFISIPRLFVDLTSYINAYSFLSSGLKRKHVKSFFYFIVNPIWVAYCRSIWACLSFSSEHFVLTAFLKVDQTFFRVIV